MSAKKIVLVVEDEPLIQEVWLEELAEFDLRVLVANDGQEALDILATTEIDLMISDLKLPVLDGFQLIERCKDDDFPIIVCTGCTGFEEALKGVRFDAVIKKPFRLYKAMELVLGYLS